VVKERWGAVARQLRAQLDEVDVVCPYATDKLLALAGIVRDVFGTSITKHGKGHRPLALRKVLSLVSITKWVDGDSLGERVLLHPSITDAAVALVTRGQKEAIGDKEWGIELRKLETAAAEAIHADATAKAEALAVAVETAPDDQKRTAKLVADTAVNDAIAAGKAKEAVAKKLAEATRSEEETAAAKELAKSQRKAGTVAVQEASNASAVAESVNVELGKGKDYAARAKAIAVLCGVDAEMVLPQVIGDLNSKPEALAAIAYAAVPDNDALVALVSRIWTLAPEMRETLVNAVMAQAGAKVLVAKVA
jgi:hypothetical protein